MLKIAHLKSHYSFSLVGSFLLSIFSPGLWRVAVFSTFLAGSFSQPLILLTASFWGSISFSFLSLFSLFLFSCKAISPQLVDYALGWVDGERRASLFPPRKSAKIFFKAIFFFLLWVMPLPYYVKALQPVLVTIELFSHPHQPAIVGKQHAEWIAKDYP